MPAEAISKSALLVAALAEVAVPPGEFIRTEGELTSELLEDITPRLNPLGLNEGEVGVDDSTGKPFPSGLLSAIAMVSINIGGTVLYSEEIKSTF